MIRVKGGLALLSLPDPPYSRESLAAAALIFGARAEVFLSKGRGLFRIEISPAGRLRAAALRELAGEFLNEALNHLYRQRVVRCGSEMSQAVLAEVLAKTFPNMSPDPLEELEPQVRLDRQLETDELFAAARALLEGGAKP